MEQIKQLINKEDTLMMIVQEQHTASYVGSGDMMVLATPIMIAMMENVAMVMLSRVLEQSQSSVGVEINCKHTKATALGAKVSATAKVAKVEGRRVDFVITACNEAGETIGEAT
ncbi:MAG: hotdog domain-containing protein, partial [Rikenellaceae bacterium]